MTTQRAIEALRECADAAMQFIGNLERSPQGEAIYSSLRAALAAVEAEPKPECRRYMDDYPGVRAECERNIAAGKRCSDCPGFSKPSEPVQEHGWLVEWRYNGIQWLYLTGGSFNFTADPNKATRFARRTDADSAMWWAIEFDRRRDLRPTGEMFVTEHVWVGALPAQSSEPQDETPAKPAIDPTDPGHDVEVLREHVRHLERRVRQLTQLSTTQRQPLTDDQIQAELVRFGWRDIDIGEYTNRKQLAFARAIEKAHGIGGRNG